MFNWSLSWSEQSFIVFCLQKEFDQYILDGKSMPKLYIGNKSQFYLYFFVSYQKLNIFQPLEAYLIHTVSILNISDA